MELKPGDLLLVFTDEITEAMNPQDEEWGVENVICCVASADQFAAGAMQHDDMTLVAARIA
jgi:sigma-B regulation protein RsbU (phosphoserine phosphatase)